MTDTYVESMVKVKPSGLMSFLKYLTITLTVLLGIATLLTGIVIALILAVVCGVLAYFISLNSSIEYEYLYCDKEVSIDKIMSQTKRKHVAKYEVEKMEILAPIKSYKLDDYKNRQCKEIDYSSKEADKPGRYVFYYEGQQRVVIDPSQEFVDAIYNVAPRKVFKN